MPTEPTRSTRAHTAVLARGLGLLLAAAVTAALVTGCGSSSSSSSSSSTSSSSTAKTNLNTTRVAKSIEQSILAQRHLKSKVTCPAAVPQEQGRTFECIALIRSTKTNKLTSTVFLVTIQNKRGYVTYVGK